MSDELEQFWEDLLSEEPARIAHAWATLDEQEQKVIRDHLLRMTTEDGWLDVQRQAAQAALDVINRRADS